MNEEVKLLIMKAGGIICSTVETGTTDKFDYHRHFDAEQTIDKIDYHHFDAEKFAELIVKECAQLNQEQSYELAGVIIDTEEGDGFDPVCLTTVKRVHDYLAGNQLTDYFGVSNGQ